MPRPHDPPRGASPEWLAELRAGSPRAITACYREHASALLTLAMRLTGERADAEDVVQDVFVGLPEALRRYEERGLFAAWLRAHDAPCTGGASTRAQSTRGAARR